MAQETKPASNTVVVRKDGQVTILTLTYPERRNALSIPLRTAFIAGLEEALADEDCRAIVITGEGKHFCAGGDISSMAKVDGVSARLRVGDIQRIIRLMINGEKPVIGAIEGHAAGAGMSIAAACDLVVAAETAIFTCSFNRVGLVPDLGAAFCLPLRMGMGRAKLAMMSGRALDARKAESWGLVEEVVPAGEALAEAVRLAQELATKAPLSLGGIKALTARMPRDLDEILRAEADLQAILFTSEDQREGMTAFMEKREPKFKGR